MLLRIAPGVQFKRAARSPILILTFLGFGLRLWRLDFQSLWWDEGVSVYLAHLDLAQLTLTKDFGVDLHAPGYHLLLMAWCAVFGSTPFATRALSAFAGTLAIPAIAWISRRLAGPPAAVLAALLLTVSPVAVYYSQETRMYGLFPLLGVLSIGVTFVVVERSMAGQEGREWTAWLLWMATVAVCLYIYYYFVLLALAESAVLLVVATRAMRVARKPGLEGSGRRRATFRGSSPTAWLAANLGLAVLYLPWLMVLRRGLSAGSLAMPSGDQVHLDVPAYLGETWQAFSVGFSTPPRGDVAMWAYVALAIAGLASSLSWPVVGADTQVLPYGIARGPTLICCLAVLLAVLVVSFVGAYGILLVRPFYYPRFILFAAVPIWILAALGLRALARWAWPASLVVVAAILAANLWTVRYERITPRTAYSSSDYRVVFQTIAAFVRPGDIVLTSYPWQVGYVESYLVPSPRPIFLPGAPDRATIDAQIAAAPRTWSLAYLPSQPTNPSDRSPLERALIERARIGRARVGLVDQYGDTRVMLFFDGGSPADLPWSGHAPVARLGDAIALSADAVTPTGAVLHPGDTVRLTLTWMAVTKPAEDYTVFAHLLGPDGKLHGQQDAPPIAGAFPTSGWTPGELVVDRRALSLAPDAPAGRYAIEIGMYDPTTGQRLPVGRSADEPDRVLLGSFMVAR